MNKTIPLRNDEAALFAKQDSLTILRLLKEQPPEGYYLDYISSKEVIFQPIAHPENLWDYRCSIKLCYPSGKYDLKETWDVFALEEEVPSIAYKAGSTAYPMISGWGLKYQRKDNAHIWRSPVTMPSEAIRWHDIEVVTTVKRLQDLTADDIKTVAYDIPSHVRTATYMGKLPDIYFIDYWNSHAKPVKEGDGYVCYPYSLECLNTKGLINDWFKKTCCWYRKKRLKVCFDPFLEVIQLTKR